MKIGAVICEYNPFHRGHAYLLSQMKKKGLATIALMSGSFTQRGEVAILSKYERAGAAVETGADLVLELPFPFCAARADRFAAGGVGLANALGFVDVLCFGSESGDTEKLLSMARTISGENFAAALHAELAGGQNIAYRSAWDAAVRRMHGAAMGTLGSNDRLGIAYLSEMLKMKVPFVPMAFPRQGEAFDGTAASDEEGYAAASTVRRLLSEGNRKQAYDAVPPAMGKRLQEAEAMGRVAREERWLRFLMAALRVGALSLSEKTPDCTVELAARCFHAATEAKNGEEFLAKMATRRYSLSRIRRVLIASYFGVLEEDFTAVRYTNVLAANETGCEILAQARKTATIPILTKPSDYRLYEDMVCHAAELSARVDAVWELLCDAPREGGAMLKERPCLTGTER